MRLTKPATLTGKQPALRGLFLVKKVQMAGKIVQMVKELSTSHRGLPALTSRSRSRSNGERENTL